jgi:hypothetical protein
MCESGAVAKVGNDVALLNRNNWRSIAVALIVMVLGTLGAGSITMIAKAQDVLIEQEEAQKQRKILTEAVVSIQALTEKHDKSISRIEKELQYQRCMQEKRDANECVPILLQL